MKKPPKGLVTERTLRSLLRTISKELRKELSIEVKLELLRHEDRLSRQLRKVAIAKEKQT